MCHQGYIEPLDRLTHIAIMQPHLGLHLNDFEADVQFLLQCREFRAPVNIAILKQGAGIRKRPSDGMYNFIMEREHHVIVLSIRVLGRRFYAWVIRTSAQNWARMHLVYLLPLFVRLLFHPHLAPLSMTIGDLHVISEPVIMNFSASRYMSGTYNAGSHLRCSVLTADFGSGLAVAGFCVMLYDHLLTFRQVVRSWARK